MNFGRPWSEEDRAILREHWAKLGSEECMHLIKSKRTERAVENEAYRLNLFRVGEDGLPIRRGPRKPAEKTKSPKPKPKKDPGVRTRRASFGYIAGGPVVSIFDLAEKL